MSRRGGWLGGGAWVVFILVMAGWQERSDVIAPHVSTEAKAVGAAQGAVLSEVTRSLALALNDGRLRAALGKAMKEQGVTYEQKLDLASFIRSADGKGLLEAASANSKRAHTSVLA